MEGWHVQHLEKKRKQVEVKQAQQQVVAVASAKQVEEEAQRAHDRARIEAIFVRFDALSDERKVALRAAYIATKEAIPLRKAFEQDQERSVIHRVMFARFVDEKM